MAIKAVVVAEAAAAATGAAMAAVVTATVVGIATVVVITVVVVVDISKISNSSSNVVIPVIILGISMGIRIERGRKGGNLRGIIGPRDRIGIRMYPARIGIVLGDKKVIDARVFYILWPCFHCENHRLVLIVFGS